MNVKEDVQCVDVNVIGSVVDAQNVVMILIVIMNVQNAIGDFSKNVLRDVFL